MGNVEAVFLNDTQSENVDNVFDFIEEKLAFGVCDSSTYLTSVGDFIVNGPDILEDWGYYANEYMAYYDYGCDSLEECSKYVKEKIKKDWLDYRKRWMSSNNVTEKGLAKLEMLYQQYLAIKAYSKAVTEGQRLIYEKIIAETYANTEINCLDYLSKIRDWTQLTDRQGYQLAAVIGGCMNVYIPGKKFANRLHDLHLSYEAYQDKIYEICVKNRESITHGFNK